MVVVAYGIPRQLPRTLTSLAPDYQRHIDAEDYEVIVVDNGSTIPVDISGAAGNVRLIRIDDAGPSPAAAINRGLAEARGDVVAVMIDGARIVSPGLLHFGRHAARLYQHAIVASLGWYLGFDFERFATTAGYDDAAEDALLASVGWPSDGYRLFEVATMDESSVDGWLQPIAESNCVFLSRATWQRLGGVDERFGLPGGGLLNLDTFSRALALPGSELVVLLGEGTFHQRHGGVATSLATEAFAGKWEMWSAEYEAIRGEAWGAPGAERPPTYLGTLPPPVLERFAWAVQHPVGPRRPPLGPTFDPVLWTASPCPRPEDAQSAALVDLAHRQLAAGCLAAAAAVARLARQHSPREPEPKRLLALLAGWLPLGEPGADHRAEYHLALGDAHGLIGDRDRSITHYREALVHDRDLVLAHVGLSLQLLPGDGYLTWLERIYEYLAPDSVLEIGVAEGVSLAAVRAPSLAIGVDPAPSARLPLRANSYLFPETSDVFFAEQRLTGLLGGRPLGVAFIDGLHLFEQALRDFINIERYCGPGSVVMFHDTLPLDEATQSRARDTQFHTGDVGKTVLCLKHYRPELEIFTISTPWTGLTLVSGFGDDASGFAARYDEAVAHFIDTPYGTLANSVEAQLNVVANDWSVVQPRLERHKT